MVRKLGAESEQASDGQYIEPMSERSQSRAKPAAAVRALPRCPGQCAVCRSWSDRPLCTECLLRYAQAVPRCRTCALPLAAAPIERRPAQCGACLRAPPPLDRTIAALDYAFPWDALLQRYKFQRAVELGDALLDRLDEALTAIDAGGADEPADIADLVLPVPLTERRLRERGYNQSWEIARRLGNRRGLRCEAELLLRVRDTAQQAQLPLAERSANVRGAFALEPRRAAELRGRHVALVDDVMTSGATLHEIARVVRQAGATRVEAWVVARTPASD